MNSVSNCISNFRYKANRAIMREQLNKLGFKQLVPEEHAGYIITSYICPNHPNFSFKQFYSKLSDKGKYNKILYLKLYRVLLIMTKFISISMK